MIGLIFLYFVSKAFYRLAELYKQNKWLYGILGVVVFTDVLFTCVCALVCLCVGVLKPRRAAHACVSMHVAAACCICTSTRVK